jgi:hypothetical protein
MREWCKEANGAKSKSMTIRRNGKIWWLSIVEEEPKDMNKVKEDVCREESEERRN